MKRNFFKATVIFLAPFMLLLSACKRNKSPYPPSIPTGFAGDYYGGVVYDFTVSTSDPEEDSVSYQFDWGDGDTSDWSYFVASDTTVTMSKAWSVCGTYSVRARAQDQKSALSKWSEALSVNILANNPPNPSILTCPQNGWVGDTYTFTSSATDSDGDSVSIRFDWDDRNKSDWSSFVPSGGSVSMSHSYSSNGVYYIIVQAKDKHEAISSWSERNSIVIGKLEWTCATNSAGWLQRTEHAAVVFDNKIWVLGGYDGDYSYMDDIWYSIDGVNWTCATGSAGWSSRFGHTSVVVDDKIWLLGGQSGSGDKNDIWYSKDGVNWTRTLPSTRWSERAFHTSVVFDDKIWVIGGSRSTSDVWYSSIVGGK
jgi:hypothetical protein